MGFLDTRFETVQGILHFGTVVLEVEVAEGQVGAFVDVVDLVDRVVVVVEQDLVRLGLLVQP